VRVISSERNLGFGAAQNRAVKEAKGEYVLLANPDLRVRKGGVKNLLEFSDHLQDFGVIGPRLVHQDGYVQESARRFPKLSDLLMRRLRFLPYFKKRSDRYLMKDVDLDVPREVDWMVGAALLMKRERFQEIGGFDERFFLFFEDTDLCRRLIEKGYSVWYFPQASFIHPKLRLSDSRMPGMWVFKKTFWIHLGSAFKYFKKWRA
jgi:GT2 family glycosyltransferase